MHSDTPGKSIVRIIRAADCPTVPWKNGGGLTREIAVYPPAADMAGFDWRLSAATVDQKGPFSAFPGIRRTLAVTQGTLRLFGPETDLTLDSTSEPVTFEGTAEITGDPVGGPALDLNAMVRAGRFDCTMERLSAGDVAEDAGTCFLLALEPQTAEGIALEASDCVEFCGPLQVGGNALLVTFFPAA